MKLNKKAGLVGVAAVALVGGTWAYYTGSLSLENPLDTGHYDNVLVEDYTPPTEVVKPGAEITKEVGVKNTGDYPVMVRIKMDESWDRGDANIITLSSKDGAKFLINYDEDKKAYLANQATNADAPAGTTADTDGLTEGDETVVAKTLDLTHWVFNPADGYWYFNGVLGKGENSGNLMEKINIATNIDLGYYEVKDYYYIGAENTDKFAIPDADAENPNVDGWKPYTVVKENDKVTDIEIDGLSVTDKNEDGVIDAIDMAMVLRETGALGDGQKLFRKNESVLSETNQGYADANYTLTITSEFVQATSDAVLDAWESGGFADINAVADFLDNVEVDSSNGESEVQLKSKSPVNTVS